MRLPRSPNRGRGSSVFCAMSLPKRISRQLVTGIGNGAATSRNDGEPGPAIPTPGSETRQRITPALTSDIPLINKPPSGPLEGIGSRGPQRAAGKRVRRAVIGAMKPYPFSLLNHLTVPVAMVLPSSGGRRGLTLRPALAPPSGQAYGCS